MNSHILTFRWGQGIGTIIVLPFTINDNKRLLRLCEDTEQNFLNFRYFKKEHREISSQKIHTVFISY